MPYLLNAFLDNDSTINATQIRRTLRRNPETPIYICTPHLNNIISSDKSEHLEDLKCFPKV